MSWGCRLGAAAKAGVQLAEKGVALDLDSHWYKNHHHIILKTGQARSVTGANSNYIRRRSERVPAGLGRLPLHESSMQHQCRRQWGVAFEGRRGCLSYRPRAGEHGVGNERVKGEDPPPSALRRDRQDWASSSRRDGGDY